MALCRVACAVCWAEYVSINVASVLDSSEKVFIVCHQNFLQPCVTTKNLSNCTLIWHVLCSFASAWTWYLIDYVVSTDRDLSYPCSSDQRFKWCRNDLRQCGNPPSTSQMSFHCGQSRASPRMRSVVFCHSKRSSYVLAPTTKIVSLPQLYVFATLCHAPRIAFPYNLKIKLF